MLLAADLLADVDGPSFSGETNIKAQLVMAIIVWVIGALGAYWLLRLRLSVLETRLSAFENRQDALDKRFDRIEDKLDIALDRRVQRNNAYPV